MAWMLAALLLPPQDIDALLRGLEDERLELRDRAQQELLRRGEEAEPALKAAAAKAAPETRARLQEILRRIEFQRRSRAVFPEFPRVTLKADARPLKEVASELSRLSGANIEPGAADPDAPVSMDVHDVPLLEALDRVCAGVADRGWAWGDDAKVLFTRDAAPSCPSAYSGPFRIRALQAYGIRGTDFRELKTSALLTLHADWDRRLKPAATAAWTFSKAVDDRGRELEIARSRNVPPILAGVGRARFRLQMMGQIAVDSGLQPETLTLSGLDPAARSVSLEGIVSFAFPLETVTVRFEAPGDRQDREAGDTLLSLRRLGVGNLYQLDLQQARGSLPGWSELLPVRLPDLNAVAVDADGAELTCRLVPMNPSGRGIDTEVAAYQILIPRTGNAKPVREVRLKYVAEVFGKSVPFALKGIPLP
jgi:hypothetical protein